MRTAVVGHVEWVEFARLERVPRPGEIVHVDETFSEPAGGGGVSAVQLAKLAGDVTLYTALGRDRFGEASVARLTELGVRVEAVFRDAPTRRAFTYLDAHGQRTITVIGPRLHPDGDDALPWNELDRADAVYFTAGDAAALRAARRARVLVATTRVAGLLSDAGVQLDAVVGSAEDPDERYVRGDIDPIPTLAVATTGEDGGRYESEDGATGTYAAVPRPGPLVDTYGSGDSFAAGLAFALARGDDLEEALELAARCGAHCAAGRGPFEGQLTLA